LILIKTGFCRPAAANSRRP